jgi:uncharacterized membrane protein
MQAESRRQEIINRVEKKQQRRHVMRRIISLLAAALGTLFFIIMPAGPIYALYVGGFLALLAFGVSLVLFILEKARESLWAGVYGLLIGVLTIIYWSKMGSLWFP